MPIFSAGAALTATAREEKLTGRTGLYRMEVRDGRGDLVALAEGLAYRMENGR